MAARRKPASATTCAKRRANQNRYVAKDPAAQRARVKRTYRKNRAAILAKKKSARKGGAKPAAGQIGRPRKGCKPAAPTRRRS